jgi:hypothetical protein
LFSCAPSFRFPFIAHCFLLFAFSSSSGKRRSPFSSGYQPEVPTMCTSAKCTARACRYVAAPRSTFRCWPSTRPQERVFWCWR